MARRMNFLAALSLMVFSLGLLVAGCGGPQTPPAPKILEAKAIQIPAPPPLEKSDIFAYLKVRDPNQLVARLGDWAAAVKPGVNAQMFTMQLQMLGINLTDFRAGGNVGVYLFDFSDSLFDPPLAAFLPLTSSSPTARKLVEMLHENNITSVGTDTIIAKNRAGLTKATELVETLKVLNNAKPADDLQLNINIGALMGKFGSMLRTQMAALQTMIATQATAKNPGISAEQMQRTIQSELQCAQDFLDQSQWLNLGIDLAPEGLSLSTMLKAKAGTGMEAFLKRGALAQTELTRYLDKKAIFKAQYSFKDAKKLLDIYMKYLAIVVGPGHEESLKKLRADLAGLEKIGKTDTALSLSLSPAGKFVEEAVMVSGNNAALEDLVRVKMIDWSKKGLLNELYKGMGMEMAITEESATRKIHGWPVRRYTLQMKSNPKMPAEQRAQFDKLFAGSFMEMCRMDPYILLTLNQPMEQLAERLFSQPPADQPIEAVKLYPPGGVIYGDLNVAELLQAMKTLLPPAKAGQIPSLAPGTPPICGFGYHGDGVAYYKLRIPRGLVTAVTQAAAATKGIAPGTTAK